jgi:hypothetical protein
MRARHRDPRLLTSRIQFDRLFGGAPLARQ